MKSSISDTLKNYLVLSKLRIMIPVSLTGFTGYFVYDPRLSPEILFVSIGVLLLGISASTLNQLQEVKIDSKMNRTHDRPIPAGKIKSTHAILFFLVNLIAGTALIYSSGSLKAAVIGLITIIWYNGIYTYTKRITAFAVVPGAITGALPPLIGWVAAGGGLWEKPIVFIEFLFFTGQIPHFWLMILKFGEEYHKAGIPSLTTVFNTNQINRLTFTWVVTSVLAAMLLCIFEIIRATPLIGILVIASAIIIWQFSDLLKEHTNTEGKNKYSITLYSYFLLIMTLLIIDRIIK